MQKAEDFDIQISNLPEEELKKLSERSFLPYIKLVGTSSDEGKKRTQDNYIEPGQWAVFDGKDQPTILTESFEAMVCATRWRGCVKTDTGIRSYYDHKSKEAQDLKVIADRPGKNGRWYGPEFLVWIRSLRSWGAYHASNKTARSRASELITILTNWDKALKAKREALTKGDPGADLIVVKNPQVTFKCNFTHYGASDTDQWAPVFTPATTPFSEVPSLDEVRERGKKFNDPPKATNETVAAGDGAAPPNERG